MASGSGKGAAPRVFPPGQQMNIWLELEAAEAHGNVNTDVFQVCQCRISQCQEKLPGMGCQDCFNTAKALPCTGIVSAAAREVDLMCSV